MKSTGECSAVAERAKIFSTQEMNTMAEAELLAGVVDETERSPVWDEYGTNVQKIVLGNSPTGRNRDDPKLLALAELPARFPQLTDLYLWQISELSHLPELPPGLLRLEARDCPDLASVANLPAGLETLVIENCPRLDDLPIQQQTFEELLDLSVAGLPLAGDRINQLLAACPNLTRFDASSCQNLPQINAWPATLDRIDLNRCRNLTGLPAKWPRRLRRLGLRGCTRLGGFDPEADFPETIDYFDLAYAENFTELPRQRRTPRTLFLFQSGILMPPGSEHGRADDENVAQRTQAYFNDVRSFGQGEVRRCKLLILGNGEAGKTCLAGSLVTDQPQQHQPDSTHGVQFWDWYCYSTVGTAVRPIHLHLWDFGGQEIYHNTHRLFMSQGAVFVVVWKPEQDGKLAPESNSKFGYQDEWRPLKYWLDTIHLVCPHKPRVAIVCSHHATGSDELRARLRAEIGDEYFCSENIPCYFHDSYQNQGEKGKLVDWIKGEVGEVVRTQGTAVPAHWEIAQSMVSSWLPESEFGSHQLKQPRYNRLPRERFGELLHDCIIDHTAVDREGKFARLAEALNEGRFELTEDRLTRTLEFLTHSGWVYWNKDLFEGQVIIGQRWALNAIYTVLDRRQGSTIYEALCNSHGQFTRQDLANWVWGDDYDQKEQQLLISFMESVGVVFRLVSREESYWGEAVYKSFEHLPKSEDLNFQRHFDSLPDSAKHRDTIQSDKLHQGDWHALLKNLGESYGTDAQYAVDGFYLHNSKDEHTYWIQVEMAENKLGGRIEISVAGPAARERCATLAEHVTSFVPDRRGEPIRGGRSTALAAGEPPKKTQVFFSYSWDPKASAIPPGYEEPVDRLFNALQADPTIVAIRDKQAMAAGDSITRFMQRIKVADKVLVIHSDKYWKSAFCMHEFSMAVDAALNGRKSLHDILIMVSHLHSGIERSSEAYQTHWETLGDEKFHNMLNDVTSPDKLKKAAADMFANKIPQILGHLDINRKWTDETAEQIIDWVKTRCG